MSELVVLLHGFTNTGRSWDPVLAALPDRLRPVVLDIRGHGSASGARPVTLEAVISDIDRAAPDPFTLVGYSMGGRIALHAAFELAGRVRRLVLIGASPGLEDAAARSQRRAADDRLAGQAERESIGEFAERWARTPVLAGQPEGVRAWVDADRRRNDTAGLAAALRGLGTGSLPSLWPRLGRLGIPVELIVGERDSKFRDLAERMAQAIPRARTTIVSQAGHAVHLEAPERVAALIADDEAAATGRIP